MKRMRYYRRAFNYPDGSKGPTFQTYFIVDATDAPETAETLKPNEWLEEIGLVVDHAAELPAKPFYRKIPASAVNQKTKTTKGEEKMYDDFARAILKRLKKHIENGGVIPKDSE